MKQLRFINPFSAGRAAAFLGFAAVVLFEIPEFFVLAIALLKSGKFVGIGSESIFLHLARVLVVPLLTFVTVVIIARFYNWYAMRFGGVEVDFR